MSRKHRKLALAAAGVLAAGVLLLRQPAGAIAPSQPTPASGGPAVASPTPAASPLPSPHGYEKYAIYLHELPGLAPDTPSGTPLRIWVTWNPSITRSRRVHLLIDDAFVNRIEEPYGDEGPMIAELLVRGKELTHLIYGVRFGSLNVSVTSD